MPLVDIFVLIIVLVGGLVGFRQGFTKSLINFIGIIVVITFSFILKNSVSKFLMSFMPFIPFGGFIKDVTVLNIILYEVIAFSLIFSILMIIFKIISITSSIFEKILNFTILLGIPSKILGTLVGLIKNYVIVFFVLYFLSMPNFSDVSLVKKSKLRDPILRNTPVLSSYVHKTLKVLDEFKTISKKYKNTDSADEFNLETLDLFLKYNITSVETVNYLVDSGKIKISGIESVISKYEK